MKTIRLLLIVIAQICFLSQANGGDSKLINYSGRILKPDSTAIDGNVTFSVKVYSPGSERCVLWHEQQVVSVSKGVFSISIGSTTNRISGLSSIDLVFKNSGTMTSLSCASGTSYTPSADDDRKLVVSFNDGSGSQTLSDLSINSVPFATTARNTEKISGTTVSGTAPSAGQVLKYNGTEWVPDTDVSGGTPADATTGSKGIVQIGAGLNVSSGTISVDTGTTSGKIPVLDGTNKIPIALLPSIPIDQISNGAGKYFTYQPNNVACSTNEFLKWDGAKWICGTAGGGSVTSVTASAPLQSSGGTTPDISFTNQTMNTILAGPSSGGAAAPTFRSLVANDLPTYAINSVMITNSSGVLTGGGGTTVGSILQGSLTGPVWSTATYPSTVATGDLLYGSGVNTVGKLAAGTNGHVLTLSSGVPTWSAITAGDFKSDGSVTMTGQLKAANGTLGAPAITFGSDLDTGIYRVSDGYMGFSANGTYQMQIGPADTYISLLTVPVGSAAAPTISISGDLDTGIFAPAANNLAITTGGTERLRVDSSGNVGIGTTSPETKLDVNGAVTMRQAYYESVGALGTLSCGSTNITGFTTNIYTLTACSSGTTTLNIPTITGWPTGNMSWVVSFYVTGQTSSVFNVSYNGATTAVYWDKNSTGGSGGASYPGFNINSGSTDIITCTVINTGSVKVFCGVAAQY